MNTLNFILTYCCSICCCYWGFPASMCDIKSVYDTFYWYLKIVYSMQILAVISKFTVKQFGILISEFSK